MKNEPMQTKPETSDEQESGSALRGAACCASSDLDAIASWGPLVIADVIGGDIAENTVTLHIHGPMPHTILGAQWFLFHDAPPAAERLPFPFLRTPAYPTGTAAPLRYTKNHDNYP